MKMSEHYTKRTISHEEAKESARRLINSHFRREPCARVGIPARPDYDDDLLIMAYICQREEAEQPPIPSYADDPRPAKEIIADGWPDPQ